MFSACLQHPYGIEIPKVSIATKRQQIICDVTHRSSPLPLSSENHERGPEREERSQTSFDRSAWEKCKKKLVNVNALLLRATVLTSYSQARWVWRQVMQYHRGAASRYWTPLCRSPSPMLCQWGYRDLLQVLAICLGQVLAGRQINFEGLAFASKAILRQNMLDSAICQLCLPFPLNNSKILEKCLIIPLCNVWNVWSKTFFPYCISFGVICDNFKTMLLQNYTISYSKQSASAYRTIMTLKVISKMESNWHAFFSTI